MADAGTVDRDGFQLGWCRDGSGIPMLVLGSLAFYPRYFPAAMRDAFELIFCDLRHFTESPLSFDNDTITPDTICQDIDAVLDATGLDRPIVAGQSIHGTIALEYARYAPDRVRGVLVVASGPPPGAQVGGPSADEHFARDASSERKAAHAHNLATRRVPETVESAQDFIDDYVAHDAMGWYDYTFDCSPLWEGVAPNVPVLERVASEDVRGRFRTGTLGVPVFLALGRHDYGNSEEGWEEGRHEFPNLRYRMYEQSGHHPPFEQADEFTADVVEWAQSL